MKIETTLRERGKRYGSFVAQAEIAQQLKAVMQPHYHKLAADQREALDHMAVKISRVLNGDPNFHDHWHDLQGYPKLVADRLAEE